MNLRLNTSIIEVSDHRATLGIFEPFNKDLLETLRLKHIDSHLVRSGRNRIETISLRADVPPIGDRFENVSIRHDPLLLAALVRESLIRNLRSTKREILRDDPVQVVSREPKDDVLRTVFGLNNTIPEQIAVRKKFDFFARALQPNGTLQACLAIDAGTIFSVDLNCADLINHQLSIIGLYVGQRVANPDPRLRPRLRIVGRVLRIEGTTLVLDDHREDLDRIQAHEAWIDPSAQSLLRCLDHFIGPTAFTQLASARGELANGPNRWKRIEGIYNRLSQQPFEVLPGVIWRPGPRLTSSNLKAQHTSEPKFVFHGNKIADTSFSVGKLGPWSAPTNSSSVSACVICERTELERTTKFLKSLRDGIHDSVFNGFCTTWQVPELTWTTFAADDSSPTAYRRAFQQAMEHPTRASWKLALVQVPSSAKDLLGDASPYFVTKAKFLTQGIPVQEFTTTTIKKPDKESQWVLRSIALQIYAKLGGTPWLLNSPKVNTHELVIGLGSASVGSGKLRQRERIVGLTTVFSGDGRYWLTQQSKAVPYESHRLALAETLQSSISEIRKTMNWQPGDRVRIILHAIKPLRNSDVRNLESVLATFTDLSFETAFLHVTSAHPFYLYSGEGDQIPPRGVCIQLSIDQRLVTILGPKDVRIPGKGFSPPLLLKLHHSSTFKDIDYLATQVAHFTRHSWRNFGPTGTPVTILYSELIAKLLGKLSKVQGWDPDILIGPIGRLRWFL